MALLLALRRRGAFVVAAFLAADAGVAMAACSTASPDPEATDATSEAPVVPPEASRDAPPVITPEAGTEASSCVSPADDKCNIVLQDCPAQQECVVGANDKTSCQPVQPSQQLGIGRSCCPNGNGNPCLPGLSCIGAACVDGGEVTARCSPACCEGDDQACGKSDPEGISGACDLQLVSGSAPSTDLHRVCTYRQRCKPFRVEPCKAGETCLVEDKVGTASCVDVFGDPPKTNRQPCVAANDCADGLQCYTRGDAGSCRYVCLFPGSAHPFDASVQNGGPGTGGCPTGEQCSISFANRPSWYALCALPDGG